MSTDLRLCFYGDDFTGSTDALESLSLFGLKAALFIRPPTRARLAKHPGLQAIGVAGMTRSLSPDAMEKELKPALKALRLLGAPHVHYKVCSTFDSSPTVGSIGRVMDVAAKIFDQSFIPLLVGAPALGRYCVYGNLFARFGGGGAIYRLDRHPSMSRHPVTPANESDLRIHLSRQTSKKIGLLDILQIERPLKEAKAELDVIISGGAKIVLFDAMYPHQLERIGTLMDGQASRGKPLFSVGSSGVEMALGAHWAASGKFKKTTRWPKPGVVKQLLVGSGSCSPVTEKQIAWARKHAFAEIHFMRELAAGKSMDEIAGHAALVLSKGRSLIIHSSVAASGRAKKKVSQNIGAILGEIIRKTVERSKIRRVCIAGGDTSGHVAHALKIELLEMIAPLVTGAPLCRATAPNSLADGLEMVFKGGQVGTEDFFGIVQRGRAQSFK